MSFRARVPTLLSWIARIAWLAVAVAGGAAVEAATSGRSEAVRWTSAVGGWALWGLVAAALVIPSVRSLTGVRLLTPVSLVVVAVTGFAGATALELILLGLPAFVASAAIFTAEFGRTWIQSTAYGNEDRMPLRPPVAAGAAAAVSWCAWCGCLLAGPLLLAAQMWIAGGVLTVAAAAGVGLLGPRWHRLTLRWLVFVPAGLVVHDPVVLADTLMVPTRQIERIHLAPASTGAADLTGPASGYALEISTTESVSTVFAFTPREPDGRAIHMTAFLVSPSRPGEALRVAAGHGLPAS